MISAYIKPTNYCNIDCDHCYLPIETRADKTVMTREQLYDSAKLIRDIAKNSGNDKVLIIWHGGEPMTLSLDWFRVAKEVLDDVFGQNGYEETLQTSLIPYKPKWSDLIHERFNSYVGSSIDFTQRKVKNSSASYIDLWLDKVNAARDDGILVIPSIVPSKNEILKAKDILKFFVDNRFQYFNIDRYSNYEMKTDDWPSNREHSHFLTALFDAVVEMAKNKQEPPIINVITASIFGVLKGVPGDRWGTECQKEFLVIEPDGSTNTCPDRISVEKPFSNVKDGFDAFNQSPERRKWIRIADVTHKKNHCHTCEFNTWCQSGCPITPNTEDLVNECSGYKAYLMHVKESFKCNETREHIFNYYLSQLTDQ